MSEERKIVKLNPKERLVSEQMDRLYKHALYKDWWIYDTIRIKWYTPEEFKALSWPGSSDNWRELLTLERVQHFEVRDPLKAIQEGNKKIQESMERLKQFTNSVLMYYRKKKPL